MTHTDILLQELAQRQHITLGELLATYGGRGYTKSGFLSSVYRLRKTGVIVRQTTKRGVYVRASVCPCCGRAL